jgi:hypothetical protein
MSFMELFFLFVAVRLAITLGLTDVAMFFVFLALAILLV